MKIEDPFPPIVKRLQEQGTARGLAPSHEKKHKIIHTHKKKNYSTGNYVIVVIQIFLGWRE